MRSNKTALKLFLALLAVAATVVVSQETELFPVLKSDVLMGRQQGGFYLVATNQLLRPWGVQKLIRGRPVDLALDSGERLLAVLNSRGVELLHASNGVQYGEVSSRTTSYTGIAFRPGDRELWLSEATRSGPDSILVVKLTELGKPAGTQRIELAGHPVPAGIAFSSDGARAWVALNRSNTVAVVDADRKRIEKEIPVGVAPFAVVAASGKGPVFVSNRGGRRPAAGDTVAPSAGVDVVVDPETGTTASGSVSVIDSQTYAVREVAVERAPAGMALSPDEKTLAVTNAHSDTVSLIDTGTFVRKDVPIPASPEGVIGSQPNAAAFAPGGKSLYVACGGNNAVAVLQRDGSRWRLAGSIPTGWFPSAIAVDREGTVHVVNIKGVGNTADEKGTFNSKAYEGSLMTFHAPAAAQLAAGTREVQAANSPRLEPAGGVENLDSLGIKYVFFIIKENRTYDQVFGDIPRGNRDPKLVMYGRDVTPNHHALAEQYVLLDNFYASGAISFEGHQWLMQGFVSDYVERSLISAPRGYAWNMADAFTVSPEGFFWQGARRPLTVRVYGEFSLPARFDPKTQALVDIDKSDLMHWVKYWQLYQEGRWRDAVGSRSGVPVLAPLLCARYPVNAMNITDQLRAEVFIEELASREKSGKMENLNVITLTSDHTVGTRPGWPTPRAMVADNDLALGRIVEAITKSRFWPHSLILVVEDDAQNGVDHIDGHRTVALAIGPHIRRGVLDSNHYNHTSMVRTIQEIFRIPPRTRFLKSARAMTSIFTPETDLTPYRCLRPKVKLDELNPPLKALRGKQRRAARQSMAMNFTDVDDAPQQLLNRILWWDSKGFDTPYPNVPGAGEADEEAAEGSE